jgi:predicted dinucleotide-utilizing enzyme
MTDVTGFVRKIRLFLTNPDFFQWWQQGCELVVEAADLIERQQEKIKQLEEKIDRCGIKHPSQLSHEELLEVAATIVERKSSSADRYYVADAIRRWNADWFNKKQ